MGQRARTVVKERAARVAADVNAGFTRKRVKDLEASIRSLCDMLIDAVCERGECDFVWDLAAPLPMAVIGDMLGVRPEEREMFLKWSDDLVSSLSSTAAEADMQEMRGNYEKWRTDFKTWGKWAPVGEESNGTTHLITPQKVLSALKLVKSGTVISLGADGQPGGEGYNADVVSWSNK